MVAFEDGFIGSQFFFTLGADLTSLDGIHCVIGEIVEGVEVLRLLNETIVDDKHRPYKDIRITHTVILDDPFPDPRGYKEPSRSPSPNPERLKNGRIAADEDIDDTQGKTEAEVQEMLEEREAKTRATILEIVGDLPDAECAPPENVLFVCKLNPVTTDDDLEIIFSRFGKIKTCEVIRDKQSGDSLQYAFIEFEEQKSCENAYFKMDNVLIDDRRIHVDFSQSVSKIKWRGKGNYTIYQDDKKGGNSEKRVKERRSRSPQRRHYSRDHHFDRFKRQQNRPVSERSRTYRTEKRHDSRDDHRYRKTEKRRNSLPDRDFKKEGKKSRDRDYHSSKRNDDRYKKSSRSRKSSHGSDESRRKSSKHKKRRYNRSSSESDHENKRR